MRQTEQGGTMYIETSGRALAMRDSASSIPGETVRSRIKRLWGTDECNPLPPDRGPPGGKSTARETDRIPEALLPGMERGERMRWAIPAALCRPIWCWLGQSERNSSPAFQLPSPLVMIPAVLKIRRAKEAGCRPERCRWLRRD